MGFICAVCGEKKSGFSMPYQIFGKDGREYPACIACSKIYDALGSKDCGELERAQADLQEKLRANPQMELSLRDLLQKRLLASRSVSNKLESAKRCVITWQRFKRPCRRPPAIPLKGTESKHTAALYARRL